MLTFLILKIVYNWLCNRVSLKDSGVKRHDLCNLLQVVQKKVYVDVCTQTFQDEPLQFLYT